MEPCSGGKHSLIEILRSESAYGEQDADAVVRWCSYCGAIVIDADFDNRTFAGRFMAMRFPTLTRRVYSQAPDAPLERT